MIDFLYIDKNRENILSSQIYEENLTSVTKNISSQSSDEHTAELGIPVIKTELKNTVSTTEGSAETYDSFYSKLIEIVKELKLNSSNMLKEPSSFGGLSNFLITPKIFLIIRFIFF